MFLIKYVSTNYSLFLTYVSLWVHLQVVEVLQKKQETEQGDRRVQREGGGHEGAGRRGQLQC